MTEDFLFERYSNLYLSRGELKKFYKGVCDGRIYYGQADMKKYLDILAKKGELLNFISFLKEAGNISYTVTEGRDSYDGPSDHYTYAKSVIYGLGGSQLTRRGSDAAARIKVLISSIELDYKYQSQQEQQKIDDARMVMAEQQEAERQLVEQKYQKYIADLSKWNSKDCYWKSANMNKRPIAIKYGLSDKDLRDCGFYDEETRHFRMFQYQFAYKQYCQANSRLKSFIFRGKAAPMPEDYGFTMDDLVSDGDYSYDVETGRGR